MPRTHPRAAAALLVVALVLAIGLVPSLAGARGGTPAAGLRTAASGVDFLNVSVSNDLTFATSITEVQPGDLVHVAVTQLGNVPHTFTLSPTAGFTFPSTDNSGDLSSYFSAHPPLVNVQIGSTTGEKDYANFTAPPYGVYEYVCTQTGHFPSMAGLIGSGEAAGSLSTNYGPGAPVYIISGTIVGLVIIALVLGFVVGKRRGSADEMPPERLGYPEPANLATEPPHAP
jgi:plastocyanin